MVNVHEIREMCIQKYIRKLSYCFAYHFKVKFSTISPAFSENLLASITIGKSDFLTTK